MNHLRDSICQREFKVLTFEWMSLIKINKAVQAVKSNLINKVVLGLSILLFGFDSTVLHSSFTPDVLKNLRLVLHPMYYCKNFIGTVVVTSRFSWLFSLL